MATIRSSSGLGLGSACLLIACIPAWLAGCSDSGGGEVDPPVENQPPAFADPGAQEVLVGETLTLTISATDPEDGVVTIEAAALPENASFDAASATFSFSPGADQLGEYRMRFTATDDGVPPASAELEVPIEVVAPNQPPEAVAPEAVVVAEGEAISVQLTATDPDGDTLTWSGTDLPDTSSLDAATGSFEWTPSFEDAGEYSFEFTVADDGDPPLSANVTLMVTVNGLNVAPVVTAPEMVSVDEGVELEVPVTIEDPDGNEFISFAEGLPVGASYDEETRTLRWTPDFNDAGTYTATIIARDDGFPAEESSAEIEITVNDVNRAPAFPRPLSIEVSEGATVTQILRAEDPDGDEVSYVADGLPAFVTLDGVLLTLRPGFDDAGSYNGAMLTATDDGTPPLSAETTLSVVVLEAVRPPTITAPGTQEVAEGTQLTFDVSAVNPEDPGTPLTVTAGALPTGATFVDGTFTWTPDFEQAGDYPLQFSATAPGDGPTGEATVLVRVLDVNRPPVIEAPDPVSVAEGATGELTLVFSDPDGDGVTLDVPGLPGFATVDGDTLIFAPVFGDARVYNFSAVVADDRDPPLSALVSIELTVTDTNRPPLVDAPTEISVNENGIAQFTVQASDPDFDPFELSADVLPPGASFDSDTGMFLVRPTFNDAGVYPVTFTATETETDPPLSTAVTTTVTIVNVNRAPEIGGLADMEVIAGEVSTPTFEVLEFDGDDIDFSGSLLPVWVSIVANPEPNTWFLNLAPQIADIGGHTVTLRANDDGDPVLSDSVSFTVTVVEIPNEPPVWDLEVEAPSVDEGELLQWPLPVSDPDGDEVTVTSPALPPFCSILGSFLLCNPGPDDAGSYDVNLVASDVGGTGQSVNFSTSLTVVDKPLVALGAPWELLAEGAIGAVVGRPAVSGQPAVLAVALANVLRYRAVTAGGFGPAWAQDALTSVSALTFINDGAALLAANGLGISQIDFDAVPATNPSTVMSDLTDVAALASATLVPEGADSVLAGLNNGDLVVLDWDELLPGYTESQRLVSLCSSGAARRIHVADFVAADAGPELLVECGGGEAPHFVTNTAGTVFDGGAAPVAGGRLVAVGDANGDGVMDIVDGDSVSDMLQLNVGDGALGFTAQDITAGARGLVDLRFVQDADIAGDVLLGAYIALAGDGRPNHGLVQTFADAGTGFALDQRLWAPSDASLLAAAGDVAFVAGAAGELLALPPGDGHARLAPIPWDAADGALLVTDAAQDGEPRIVGAPEAFFSLSSAHGRDLAFTPLAFGTGPSTPVVYNVVSDDPAGVMARAEGNTVHLLTRDDAMSWAASTLTLQNGDADSVGLADIDGDGLVDVAALQPESGVLEVIPSTLGASRAIVFGPGPGAPIALVPAAGLRSGQDGFFVIQGNGQVRVLGFSGSSLQISSATALGCSPGPATAADSNGDGVPDLVMWCGDGDALVSAHATGAGGLSGIRTDALGLGLGTEGAIVAGHFDADGRTDVALVHSDGGLWLAVGKSGGGFSPADAVLYVSGGSDLIPAPPAPSGQDSFFVVDGDNGRIFPVRDLGR